MASASPLPATSIPGLPSSPVLRICLFNMRRLPGCPLLLQGAPATTLAQAPSLLRPLQGGNLCHQGPAPCSYKKSLSRGGGAPGASPHRRAPPVHITCLCRLQQTCISDRAQVNEWHIKINRNAGALAALGQCAENSVRRGLFTGQSVR